MKANKIKNKKLFNRLRRVRRIRSRVSGTSEKPRLAVFRSNRYIYVQAIDDTKGVTLASASDIKIDKGTKTERAMAVGKDIADKLAKLGIKKAVFDRRGFKYTGRVKALADAAREGGLEF